MTTRPHSDNRIGSGRLLVEGRPITPLLDVTSVTAGYGTSTVLRGVDLRVQPGQIVALLGPNGAGKTTMLRTIAGIVRASQGTIHIEDVDVSHARPHQRAELGICLIPEGRGVFRSLTVRENLRLQLASVRKRTATFDRALDVFPALSGRLNEVAGRLSGGQQQMLALARAYLTHPKVILLDEVSMGLAPRIIDEIFYTLHQLAQTGVAMVLVEQYVARAMDMADDLVLLNKGTVAYHGPPSGLDEEAVLRGYLGVDFSTEPTPPG